MWKYRNSVKLHQVSYSISKPALSLIVEESQQKYPNETGGILVGKYNDDKLTIKVAIGPGPHAIHARYSFHRDGNYAQEKLDQLVSQSMGVLDYLGEWHSHPQNVGPSATDIDSLKRIASNPKYAIKNPILGLAVFENDKWVFYCFAIQLQSATDY